MQTSRPIWDRHRILFGMLGLPKRWFIKDGEFLWNIRKVFGPFIETFLVLIPKFNHPNAFAHFRPISLGNCVYKIMTKIIAPHLQPILSKNIFHEQFGFLEGCRIHEGIRIAQECFHSIQAGKKKGITFKVYLSKYFDHANGLFIHLSWFT